MITVKQEVIIVFTAIATILASCNEEDEKPVLPNDPADLSFTFTQDAEGWTGDFADYPIGEEESYELEFEYSNLPQPLNTAKGALKISGNNYSDDLFMFIKKKVNGLTPNATYEVTFEVEFASDAPRDSFGVGGSPGSGVSFKVGITNVEPDKIKENGYYRMNIDKDNQANSGKDMLFIGDVGNGLDEFKYNLVTRDNKDQRIIFTADKNGEGWLVIGTDSGFEATTTLYYNQIKVKFKPADPAN